MFRRSISAVSSLLFFFSVAALPAPTIKYDDVNGRVETILNLDIDGTLFNVSFDRAFGGDYFDGNDAGAEAAVDSINTVLNDMRGTIAVDNGHPDLFGVYRVYSDITNRFGWAGCDSSYLTACSPGWEKWHMFDEDSRLADPAPTIFFAVATPVAIDVRPGVESNQVFPNKSGKLPVAVLSSADFDATQVNPASLEFGSAEATIVDSVIIDDVDGEYGDDSVAKFNVAEAGIFCDDTEVTMSGETYAGDPFASTDNIDASDCVEGGCHPY